nr:calmodulin-binding receptor-like cytoplasmic kinase 2 [Ipomoea batatas]
MKSPSLPSRGGRYPSSSSGSMGFRTSSSYSTQSSSTSSKKSTASGKSSVKCAAQAVAGALIACFSPPDSKDSSFDDSNSFKAPSVSPGVGHERRRSSSSSLSRSNYENSNILTEVKEAGSGRYTMEEIYKATKNFSPSLKIGQGGFGMVYKGCLEDGTLVAVKRVKTNIYDKHLGAEFRNEVETLAKIEHLNLVRFYGFLEQEDEKIIVVEYVSNGTLREHLDCLRGNVLDLATRLDIAIDVAHAITYLHMYTDHPIIHRDIKSSNILLTENCRAKVADFGFARLAADSETGATHVSTQVKGTAGYLDPEYLRTYQLSEKSDVYSFGILLVELVTGRQPIEPSRNINERITARWAMKKFSEGDATLTLDIRLERSAANIWATEQILGLALQCLAAHRHDRPAMKKCAETLWSIRKDYKES